MLQIKVTLVEGIISIIAMERVRILLALLTISLTVIISGCGNDDYLDFTDGMCTIQCPEGVVCDDSFDYRAYMCRQDDILVYMSFEADIAREYSMLDFEQYFNYYNIWIYFPEKQKKKKEVYYTNKSPIRDFPVIDYEDGIITLRITGTIDEITTKIERRINCQTGDINGICYETESANIPYDHTLTFIIE